MPENNRYPKLVTRRGNLTEVSALLTKLVRDPTAPGGNNKDRQHVGINRYHLDRLANETAQDVIDSDAIMQLLPDLELAEQVLVGSVLSPKDMSTADVNFAVAENQFDGEIARLLLDVPSQWFKQDYKIDERLDLEMEDIVTKKGASIKIILPENSLDTIINGERHLSMEQYDQVVRNMNMSGTLGILGHPTDSNISMEAFGNTRVPEEYSTIDFRGIEKLLSPAKVFVSDNFNILKGHGYKRRRQTMDITKRLNQLQVSMEGDPVRFGGQGNNHTEGATAEQIDQLYRRGQVKSQPTYLISPPEYNNRPSVGNPLVISPSMESVVPVFVPGKPDEHVGYFLLLDMFGRPITRSENRDYYGEMRANFKNNQSDNSSELLRMTREAMGSTTADNQYEVEQVQQTYNAIMEGELKNRLRNGLYGEEFDIGFTEEIQRIMLYRHFKNSSTQLLYIPAELVVYIAFNYNKSGIGQTMLARSKILANMRSVLLFAETMGAVRNAVGRKKVNITLDPDDPDKAATISDIQTMILEASQRGFPLGAPDPAQSLDFLNRAAFDFAINAEGDDYAQTKVEYDDYNTNIQAGNPDLQDRLRRMHIAGMGVPPEKVDPNNSVDFATSAVQNDLIMTRRVKRYQRILMAGMTKFVRVYTLNSSRLMGAMVEIVLKNPGILTEEQKKMTPEEVVQDFVKALTVSLPEPDTTRLDQLMQAFEQFNSLLERALEAYLTPDMFPQDTMGEGGVYEKAFAAIKAYFQRQYLSQNNVLPQLNVLYELDPKNNKPAFSLLDNQENAVETLGQAIQEYAANLFKIAEKWKKDFPDTAGSQGGGGGFDNFTGGGDDGMGLDGGLGGDNAAPDMDGGMGGDLSGDGLDLDMSSDMDAPTEPGADDMPPGEPTEEVAPAEEQAQDEQPQEQQADAPAEEEEEEAQPTEQDAQKEKDDKEEDKDK